LPRQFRFTLLLRVAVSIGLVGYLLSLLDWEVLSGLEPDYLGVFAGCVATLAVLLFAMVWRWKRMLDHECEAAASPWLLYRFYLIGLFFSVFLPGAIGGDVVRIAYARRQFGLGWRRSGAIVLSERLFGLSALGCILVVGLLLGSRLDSGLDLGWVHGLVAVAAAIGVFVAARELSARRIKVSYGGALVLLVLSAVGQAADILNAAAFARYFGYALELRDLMVIMPVVYVGTVLPISLGGLGVREGIMVGLLSLLGVEPGVAVVIALSLYLTKVVLGLVGGALYGAGERIPLGEIESERTGASE
jgi:uncharacterized membrane protein YbhN (UPF0104 family)